MRPYFLAFCAILGAGMVGFAHGGILRACLLAGIALIISALVLSDA